MRALLAGDSGETIIILRLKQFVIINILREIQKCDLPLRSWTRDTRSSGVADEQTIAGTSNKATARRCVSNRRRLVAVIAFDNMLLLLVTDVNH